MADKNCGTCRFFIFGMRSFCGWMPNEPVPSSFNLNSMWVTDGKDCPTWEPEKSS